MWTVLLNIQRRILNPSFSMLASEKPLYDAFPLLDSSQRDKGNLEQAGSSQHSPCKRLQTASEAIMPSETGKKLGRRRVFFPGVQLKGLVDAYPLLPNWNASCYSNHSLLLSTTSSQHHLRWFHTEETNWGTPTLWKCCRKMEHLYAIRSDRTNTLHFWLEFKNFW